MTSARRGMAKRHLGLAALAGCGPQTRPHPAARARPNTMMETWLQSGSTGYDPFQTNATQAGCFLCHHPPSAFVKGNRQDDLSHYPGKLPQDSLRSTLDQLLPAGSPHPFTPAPHPRKPRPLAPPGAHRAAGR